MEQNDATMSNELDVEEDVQSSFPLGFNFQDWGTDDVDNGVPIPTGTLTKTTSLEIDAVVEAALFRWASKTAPDSRNESSPIREPRLLKGLSADSSLMGDLEDDNAGVGDVGNNGIDVEALAALGSMAKERRERNIENNPEAKEATGDKLYKRVDNKDRKRAASSSQSQSTLPSSTGSRRRKKPKGMPKRPLSAYNIFFQRERPKVLRFGEESAPKVGFQELAKTVGKRWGLLEKEDRKEYEILAEKDKIRYRTAMEAFKEAGSDDENTVDLPEKSKLAPCREHVADASTFGNISVSTCPPPTPIPFFNNVAGPLQARLPWSEPVESRRDGSPPNLYRRFSDQEPQQQQPQMRSFHSFLQEQQSYDRASNASFPQDMQQQQQQQRRSSAPMLSSASAPAKISQDSQNIMQGMQQQQLHYRDSYPTFPPGQQQQQQPRTSAPQPSPVTMPSKPSEDPRNQQNFPIPPGMEIVLPDHNGVERRYTVKYNMYSMKRDDALQYMERLASAGQGPTNEQNHAKHEGGDTASNA
jgi:hypothetical protein